MNGSIFEFDKQVTALPVVHGSLDFALEARRILLQEKWDCIAVPLPASLQPYVSDAVQKLPLIHAVVVEEPEHGGAFNYVPVEPCQPVIMAIRIAQQEYIPVEFVDMEIEKFEEEPFPPPDPYSIKFAPLEKICVSLIPALPRPQQDSQADRRIRFMANELRQLAKRYPRILCICSLAHWVWLREAYRENFPVPESAPFFTPIQTVPVEERSLAFAMNELPFVAYLYEKARRELMPDENLSIDGVKQLVLEAREKWLSQDEPIHNWATPQRLQVLMQYIRNLTLMQSRLTPDLYTLALAAKQSIGDTYAIRLVETAKEYPYQHISEKGAAFGIDQIQLPDGGVGFAKNRLLGVPRVWRNLPLKRVPELAKQKEWLQRWNPYGICSWPPEDERVESFNTHVRDAAKALIGEGLARTHKFTSSLKDGLDIRETIRNWYTGDLYVKEVPPSRGSIEIVVFLFDMPADPDKYVFQTTWYAEHEEESTLSFFATPIGEKFVGPGIAQCVYGGCMFLYPPRYIPDLWMNPRFQNLKRLEDRLLAGAFYYSQEKHVAVVSPRAPSSGWKWLAKKYKKKIVHIPLSRFSQQTIDRLRVFHVLNGKEIRSIAPHFIRDL